MNIRTNEREYKLINKRKNEQKSFRKDKQKKIETINKQAKKNMRKQTE